MQMDNQTETQNPAIHQTESQLSAQPQPDRDPVTVYLAGLSPSSRRTMRNALDTIARLGLGKETVTAHSVPWAQLRFQHTQALRSALADRYAHTTANRPAAQAATLIAHYNEVWRTLTVPGNPLQVKPTETILHAWQQN